MNDARERRRCKRYSHEEPVMIHTKDNPDMSYYGRTYNYSEKGMYIETDADLAIGKYYMVKMLSCYSDAKGPEPYPEHFGAVRWVRKVDSDKSDSGYSLGYGLEYA